MHERHNAIKPLNRPAALPKHRPRPWHPIVGVQQATCQCVNGAVDTPAPAEDGRNGSNHIGNPDDPALRMDIRLNLARRHPKIASHDFNLPSRREHAIHQKPWPLCVAMRTWWKNVANDENTHRLCG
jgi:hypothetical protein